MKNSVQITITAFLVVLFTCALMIWADTSQAVADYKWIHSRDTEGELVAAFVTALRINHPAAYEMIDPSLKPRWDEWMNTHPARKCASEPYIFLSGKITRANGEDLGWEVVFGCAGERYGDVSFKVDRIFIKDMKIIDWGEVRER